MIWALWIFVGFVVGGVCYGFNLGVAIGVWAFRGFGFGVLRVGTLFPMGLVWGVDLWVLVVWGVVWLVMSACGVGAL